MGHAATAEAEDPAGLGAPGDHEVLGAVEGLEGEMGAERRLAEREVELVDEVEALPLEAGVAAHPDVHVQVALAAAAQARPRPRPGRRSVAPVSTPAGMSTV